MILRGEVGGEFGVRLLGLEESGADVYGRRLSVGGRSGGESEAEKVANAVKRLHGGREKRGISIAFDGLGRKGVAPSLSGPTCTLGRSFLGSFGPFPGLKRFINDVFELVDLNCSMTRGVLVEASEGPAVDSRESAANCALISPELDGDASLCPPGLTESPCTLLELKALFSVAGVGRHTGLDPEKVLGFGGGLLGDEREEPSRDDENDGDSDEEHNGDGSNKPH